LAGFCDLHNADLQQRIELTGAAALALGTAVELEAVGMLTNALQDTVSRPNRRFFVGSML
jgi:hypothetical protein